MRLKISHATAYSYSAPARSIIQSLRLTPRSFDTQYVLRWRVSVDVDASLRLSEDSLGNVVHTLSYQKPVERVNVTAIGEVETSDAVGIVRGAVETLPQPMFLRASPLAQVNGALRDFIVTTIAGVGDPLERLHLIMGGLHSHMVFDAEAQPTDAAESFALKRGAAADFAHAFIACARWLEIPARFVSGYLAPSAALGPHGLFAWAEAVAPALGWVAFDAVNDTCADERYVRVAIGFDSLGAAPYRGSHSGGGDEAVSASVEIEQAMAQSQN